MVGESLQAVFEAEKKARTQIETAQREASLILESARKESEKLKAGSKVLIKNKAQKILEESRKNAEVEVQALLKDAQKKALSMEKRANERRDQSIELITESVLR
jgi:V/A-type H+-transporting ATPase subunit G/H